MEDTLTDIHIAEIRKAFALCDNGSGVINSNELRMIMANMLGSEPSDVEFNQLLKIVDKDQDGMISWDDFLGSMRDWFKEDWKTKDIKRRKLNPEDERIEIHRNIKLFFSQFKPAETFDHLRSILVRAGSMVSPFYNLDNPSQTWNIDDPETIVSSQDKIDFLLRYRQMELSMPTAIEAISTDNPYLWLEAMTHFCRLLSIVEVFNNPKQRRALVDDIVRLYETIIRHQLYLRFMSFLSCIDKSKLQYQALRALTYFAPGPRIASTPTESDLHPSKMYFKILLLSEGIVPMILKLLELPINEEYRLVVEQDIILVGTIASNDAECRDHLLNNGVLVYLLKAISIPLDQIPMTLLRAVSWTLSILVGVTHSPTTLPKWDQIQMTFPVITQMFLLINNEDVIRNNLVALSLILPGLPPETTICRRFVELLTVNNAANLVELTLNTLVDLLQYDDPSETNTNMVVLLQLGLLKELKALGSFSKETKIRIAVANLCGVIAEKRLHSLIEDNMLPMLLTNVLSEDESISIAFIRAIKQMTKGNAAQVNYIVSGGVISTLSKRLEDFKKYDPVLTSVYKYDRPRYNFDMAREVLTTLSNIVKAGEFELDINKGVNPYALAFDLEGLLQL